MSVREDIKILLAKENITLTELAKELSNLTNKTVTLDSLSQKLRRSTMKYDEVKLIAKSLGYKIKFEKEN
jgi:hypothetical protein